MEKNVQVERTITVIFHLMDTLVFVIIVIKPIISYA